MVSVSIIVPVYNVEKYIDRCLNSLVTQSLSDIEIIVVNDGSPDSSQSIIDKYLNLYPEKVFSYQKENGGLSDARNFGLNYSHGEYIGFIDSDDFAEFDMFEKMYRKAKDDESDLVLCDILYEWENSSRVLNVAGLKSFKDVSIQKRAFLSPLFAWNKLYHRKFFFENTFRYPKGLWYEDIPVSLPIFANSLKISYISYAFVHYQQRSDSIMGAKFNPKQYDIFQIMEMTVEYFKKNELFDRFRQELEYACIEQLLLYGGFRFLKTNEYRQLYNQSFVFMNEYFSNWRKNMYIEILPKKYRFFLTTLNPISIQLIRQIFKIKY